MKGEIVALHLIDVGGTFDLAALEHAFVDRQPKRGPAIGKGTPPYVEFPQPLIVRQAPVQLEGPAGQFTADVQVLYFPIGAVSIRFRAKVEVDALQKLASWPQTVVHLDGKRLPLGEAARALFDQDRPLWEPAVRERYTSRVLHESYTVFGFYEVGEAAEAFLERHQADVAAVLKSEPAGWLHEKEAKEAVRRWFSYYADDVIVVDWDAAFIIDPDADYEDLLFVLEIANLQLLEFRAYDTYLDGVIARSYDELAAMFRRPGRRREVRRKVQELSLLRIEIAELADEADNITKFLGDWFLARVYQAAQEKFHLDAWRATVDDKLSTLNKLYQLVNEEGNTYRMITLEILIVLLFVVDLLLLFFFEFR